MFKKSQPLVEVIPPNSWKIDSVLSMWNQKYPFIVYGELIKELILGAIKYIKIDEYLFNE